MHAFYLYSITPYLHQGIIFQIKVIQNTTENHHQTKLYTTFIKTVSFVYSHVQRMCSTNIIIFTAVDSYILYYEVCTTNITIV